MTHSLPRHDLLLGVCVGGILRSHGNLSKSIDVL